MSNHAIIIPSEAFDDLSCYGGSCQHVPILDRDDWRTGATLTVPIEDDDEGYTHVQIEVGGGVVDLKADYIGAKLKAVGHGFIALPTLEVCLNSDVIMTICPDDYEDRLDRILGVQ